MAASKPAMKFSLGGKKSNGAKSTTIPTNLKRPLSVLNDEEEQETNQGVEISAFDSAAGGAIDASGPKHNTLLVIQRQPNRDWRKESRKRQRSNMPGQAQNKAENGSSANVEKDAVNGTGIAYGLTVVSKDEWNGETSSATELDTSVEASKEPIPSKSEDQLALEALLGNEPKSNLVLPAPTEAEAFQNDYHSAPDMASLEDYERVKVEDFGAALLRGMGWKDGEEIGRRRSAQPSKSKPIERRPALLGIGAKENAAVGVELGEWGKAAKGKRVVDQTYNPVMLVNKDTGEKLTEDELKKRMEQQKMIEEGKEDAPRSSRGESDHRRSGKSSRRYDDGYEEDERDRRRRKEKERERDRDKEKRRNQSRERGQDRDYDSRHRSSRRDRSSSTDSRRKRKRRDDDHRDSDGSKRRHKDERYERGSSKREDRERDRYEASSRRRRDDAY